MNEKSWTRRVSRAVNWSIDNRTPLRSVGRCALAVILTLLVLAAGSAIIAYRWTDAAPPDASLSQGLELRALARQEAVGGATSSESAALAQLGRQLDPQETSQPLVPALGTPSSSALGRALAEMSTGSVGDIEAGKIAIGKMVPGPLTLQFEARSWSISQAEIAQLLVPTGSASDAPADINEDRIAKFVSKLADEVDQEPRLPRIKSEGARWRVIEEGRPGYTLDTLSTGEAIKTALLQENRTVGLSVEVKYPAALSDERGAVQELVGTATTSYAGGLPERRFNVELAAAKLDGLVVGPGEVFSFNRELGPMTVQAGFKWGLGVSQSGGRVTTVPSVAGGICQVSTTLFQALFWAGYQIEERSSHLYWIDRYGLLPSGLKGLDATVDQVYDKNGNLVYAVDFKFKNTTPYPVLIEAKADSGRLEFNLYSTNPQWKVTVDPPKIENVVKADTTVVRELDASLEPGEEVTIEVAEDGFKSTIVRSVTEGGSWRRELRVISSYKPSRNVVRVGRPLPSGPAEARPPRTTTSP